MSTIPIVPLPRMRRFNGALRCSRRIRTTMPSPHSSRLPMRIRNRPDAPRARQSAAAILSAQGKNDERMRILADLGKDPAASDSVLYDLAWAQRKTSHVPAAEEAYRRIVSQYPDSPTATLARTELAELLYDGKSYSQAAAMLWPVVNAGKADAKVLAAAGYRLGWCYQKLGDFDKAADCFRNFVARFPHNEMAPSALLQCALADADAGRDEAAQKELAAMLQQYPEHKDAPVAMLKLADVQAARNDFAGSQQTAESFLQKYPKQALAYRAPLLHWLGIGKSEEI